MIHQTHDLKTPPRSRLVAMPDEDGGYSVCRFRSCDSRFWAAKLIVICIMSWLLTTGLAWALLRVFTNG